jgi:2'-5' RNA ligase
VRLFVAIALDQATRDLVVVEQQRLVSALGSAATSLRLVGPKQLHLTLAFIGEVGEHLGRAMISEFAADFEQCPFVFALGGAGVFPARGPSRVLWLGVPRGAAEVIALQKRVVQRLNGFGVAGERRPFSPHLTIGRWRSSTRRVADKPAVPFHVLRSAFDVRRTGNAEPRTPNGERRTENAERRTPNAERRTPNVERASEHDDRTIAQVAVTEVTMFQSRLSSTGPAYTVLTSACLTCP